MKEVGIMPTAKPCIFGERKLKNGLFLGTKAKTDQNIRLLAKALKRLDVQSILKDPRPEGLNHLHIYLSFSFVI